MGLREMTKATLVSLAICALVLGARAWPASQAINTLPLVDKRAEAKAPLMPRRLDNTEQLFRRE